MDICLQRPIFATLSRKENTIRLWNYKKPNCELIKVFESKSDGIEQMGSELINCLSLHPLGYYLAVGCCDKLRIYHILEN
jgi:WD40 repeat protein